SRGSARRSASSTSPRRRTGTQEPGGGPGRLPMTEAPHDQPSAAGSGAGDRPSLWQRVVRSTGQPPAWGVVRYLAGGLAAGIAFSAALPHFRATLLSALAGGIVAAAASGGPSGIARRVAVAAAGWNLVLMVVAFATGNHPILAALAMAAVAVLTSAAGAAGPLGGVLGFLLSLSYLLVATLSR